jgi:hypothetical protein
MANDGLPQKANAGLGLDDSAGGAAPSCNFRNTTRHTPQVQNGYFNIAFSLALANAKWR